MTDYTAHPEYRALLAAVCATPADDLPRLVLADWLDEHGQPDRAGVIRVQVALGKDRRSPYLDNHRARRLHSTALRLLGLEDDSFANGLAWFRGGGGDDSWRERFKPEYDRGFVSGVACSLDDWLLHGPAVVRSHPLEVVRVTDREPMAVVVGWHWFRDVAGRTGVPEPVWRHLGPDCQPADVYRASFDSRAAATDALSAALLAWAKAQPVPPEAA